MKLYEFDAIWEDDTDGQKLGPITIDLEHIVCFNKSKNYVDNETISIEFISGTRYSILFNYKDFKKLMQTIEKELATKSN